MAQATAVQTKIAMIAAIFFNIVICVSTLCAAPQAILFSWPCQVLFIVKCWQVRGSALLHVGTDFSPPYLPFSHRATQNRHSKRSSEKSLFVIGLLGCGPVSVGHSMEFSARCWPGASFPGPSRNPARNSRPALPGTTEDPESRAIIPSEARNLSSLLFASSSTFNGELSTRRIGTCRGTPSCARLAGIRSRHRGAGTCR